MNTNQIIGLVVAVVVIAGGAYYFMNRDASTTATDTNGDNNQAVAGAYSGSLVDLARRGGDWQCTVDTTTAGTISSGVVRVSGQKMSAEFTSAVQGYGTVKSYIVSDGSYTYSWSSMMKQGIKVPVLSQGSGGTQTSGQGLDASQSYSYDCQPWTADASVFAVPSDIVFSDVK